MPKKAAGTPKWANMAGCTHLTMPVSCPCTRKCPSASSSGSTAGFSHPVTVLPPSSQSTVPYASTASATAAALKA